MDKPYRTVPIDEITRDYSPERKARIQAMADVLIAEEMALRDVRKARSVTQEQLAARLGGKQVYISRMEKRADIKLSTLRDYVRGLGGELALLVTFPDGAAMRIKDRETAQDKATARERKLRRTRPLKNSSAKPAGLRDTEAGSLPARSTRPRVTL